MLIHSRYFEKQGCDTNDHYNDYLKEMERLVIQFELTISLDVNCFRKQ